MQFFSKNAMEYGKYSYNYNHLQIKQISALNNPYGVDTPLDKTKPFARLCNYSLLIL